MNQRRAVGVLLPRLEGDYFSLVVAGVHQATRQRGYELLVIIGTPQDIVESGVAAGRVDGWITVARTAGLAELTRGGAPAITIATIAPDHPCPAVLPDNHRGMYAAVRHLVEHGHRAIAFAGGMANLDVRQRFEGYQAALRDAGIAPDEGLHCFVESNQEPGGAEAIARLGARGGLPTALATATDDIAIGALGALRAAGLSVPGDVALASFDDIDRAQHLNPPLTTVRQRPDEVGRVAAERLLDLLDAGAAPPPLSLVATALIVRQSCGCVAATTSARQARPAAGEGWAAALREQLVDLALHPLPRDPQTPAGAIWPGVDALVGGLQGALGGQPPGPAERLELAWRQAIDLTFNLDTLNGLYAALERAGRQARPAGPAGAGALDDFLDGARLALLRARLARERQVAQHFEQVSHRNYAISMGLLGAELQRAGELGWLGLTSMLGGCLGLWEAGPADAPAGLRIAGAYARAGEPGAAPDRPVAAGLFPPAGLLAGAGPGGGAISFLLPVRSDTRDWGVLALCSDGQHEVEGESMTMWSRLLGAAIERSAALEALTSQRAQLSAQQESLREAYDRERMLAETVRALGSPVLELLPDVLLVPLIGAIDSARAQDVIGQVLEAVQRQAARVVLIDLTGVPLIDTQVANALLQAGRAAALLGARTMLIGVRPEIAQSVVGLGLDLSAFEVAPSLAVALRRLLPGPGQGAGAGPGRRR